MRVMTPAGRLMGVSCDSLHILQAEAALPKRLSPLVAVCFHNLFAQPASSGLTSGPYNI